MALFSHEGEASTHPGSDNTPALTGSSNTNPSDATLRNISQNMYGATVVRSDCATAGRTTLYCNALISETTSSLARA